MERFDLGNGSWIIQGKVPDELFANNNPKAFEDLWDLHPVEFNKVKMMDKVVSTPRWQQSYNKPYYFTGMLHEALPTPPVVNPFLEWANSMGHGEYNQILINWYENGHHYIGAHSDDEGQIVKLSPIVSISIGAERVFRIRSKFKRTMVMDIPMPSGTYLIMGGNMQKHFLHEVPKINGMKGEAIGKRINLTFRQFTQ